MIDCARKLKCLNSLGVKSRKADFSGSAKLLWGFKRRQFAGVWSTSNPEALLGVGFAGGVPGVALKPSRGVFLSSPQIARWLPGTRKTRHRRLLGHAAAEGFIGYGTPDVPETEKISVAKVPVFDPI